MPLPVDDQRDWLSSAAGVLVVDRTVRIAASGNLDHPELTPSCSTPGWTLAIDFGTRTTRAAVAYHGRNRIAEAAATSSVVRWDHADGQTPPGELRAGNAWPTRRASSWRGECAPKRLIGEERLWLDGVELDLTDVVAALLREVAETATARQDGVPPDTAVLTHPGWWSARQVSQLEAAGQAAGLPTSTLMPDPVAAAAYFASAEIPVGEPVAVLDMGDGSFDAAVLRRTRDGYELLGESDGSRTLGGGDFEDRVYRFLGRRLSPQEWDGLQRSPDPEWRRADHRLWSDIGFAISLFSYGHSEYAVTVPAPIGRKLTLTREQLIDLIAADIEAAVDRLAERIAQVDLAAADLAAICLAGSASATLLVGDLIRDRLGHVPLIATDPALVVALGAARAALPVTRSQPGHEHRSTFDPNRRFFTPAETMPRVARDNELDAVLIMDHDRWLSRERGVWSRGSRWSRIHEFTAVRAHPEIFRLLDEAEAALGAAGGA